MLSGERWEANVTLDDLTTQLRDMPKGKYAHIPYEIYEQLWPPGEPDQRARAACFDFAKANGCRVENKPEERAVWIVKDT